MAVPWPQEVAGKVCWEGSAFQQLLSFLLWFRIVTASKDDAFTGVAAQPGLECSQCLSTGMEKQPCCAKMQQEGPASWHWCKSHVHR